MSLQVHCIVKLKVLIAHVLPFSW